MTIEEFKKIVASIPSEYDEEECNFRFGYGSPFDRKYSVANVRDFNIAVLQDADTKYLALYNTCVEYGDSVPKEMQEKVVWSCEDNSKV